MAHPSSTIPAQSSRTRGPAITFLSRRWDFAAVLLLIAATVPPVLLSSRQLSRVETANIDDSWFVDSNYKAVHGIWMGGHVTSTYGPILQWLSSLPVRLTGYSMGKVYQTWPTVPMWMAFLLSAFTLRLLLPEQPAWKRFVLIIFIAIFWASPGWSEPDMRPFTGLFIFTLFLTGWYSVAAQRVRPILFGAGAALVSVCAFLVAADTGVYAIAAFVITLGGLVLENRFRRSFLKLAAIASSSFLLGLPVAVFLINLLRRKPFDLTFWKASLVMVSTYRWYEPFPMEKVSKFHLVATLVAGVLIFGLRRFAAPNEKRGITARTGFLAAALVYGFLSLQSGLVRSDTFHVQIGMFAMVVLIGAVLFGFEAGRAWSTVAVVFALVFSWFFVTPNGTYFASNIADRYVALRHPWDACPPEWAKIDQVCFPASYTSRLENVKAYIQGHTTPQESIVIFPWNNIFGSITQRNVAGGIMLSYVASDKYLSDLDLRELSRVSPSHGLYFHEGWGWPVDGVPNFTRNPWIWFWLQRNYSTDQVLADGILGLKLDKERADKVTTLEKSLQLPTIVYTIVSRRQQIDLGQPAWPRDGADLLRLRLKVSYPIWWKIRKPMRSQLEITRADGSKALVPFELPCNSSTEVWFNPWSAELTGFFSRDEAQWHAGSRPPITHLRLLFSPLDSISVKPNSVSVEAVDAVSLTLAPQATTSQPPVPVGLDLITDKR